MAPGEVVIKQGEVGDSFYIIEEGTFTCYLDDGTKLALVDRGSCFGELALLHNEKRACNVAAERGGGARYSWLPFTSFRVLELLLQQQEAATPTRKRWQWSNVSMCGTRVSQRVSQLLAMCELRKLGVASIAEGCVQASCCASCETTSPSCSATSSSCATRGALRRCAACRCCSS